MPLLASLLVTLFGAVVAWLGQFLTRKIAYGVAAIAMMSTLTGGLFILMRAILSALSESLTGVPELFLQAVALAVPPVAPICLSSYITIWVACTAYRWQRDLLYIAMAA